MSAVPREAPVVEMPPVMPPVVPPVDDQGVGGEHVEEEVTLCARDGYRLAARRYVPVGAPVRGVAVIAPAMGVPQRFYGAFARWLASKGVHVLTFDYRGMGDSRAGSLRALSADIMTWARLDASAALAEVRERAPGVPLLWFGHSLGGQLIPYVEGHEAIARAFVIAAGSGYWRDNADALRRRVWLFWWGAVPVLTPLFGYFPGRRIGMVGDLPKGVIAQWRSWCMHPEYLVGVVPDARARFAAVQVPITALSFTDDEMMSERGTRVLEGFFTGASVSALRLKPGALGVKRVGHFGFFRGVMRAPLWEAHVWSSIADTL
jgi:predicted alpha/beta hydrolase